MRATESNLRNNIRKEIAALKEYRSNTFMLSQMELDNDIDESDCEEGSLSPGKSAVILSSPRVWKTSKSQSEAVKDFINQERHKNMNENKKTSTSLLSEAKVGKNVMLKKQHNIKFKKIAENRWQCTQEINEKQILSLIADNSVANVIKNTIAELHYVDIARGSLIENLSNAYPKGLTFVRKENGMFQEAAYYSDDKMDMILEQTHKMIKLRK